jgi:L-aminopeptidase/D-esterase-like protein
MPIVPKRQDFVSALFRRPTTTSKKDKPKQSKKLNNHTAEKSATDPPLGSGETIREGADGASGDVVVATEAMDTPETTQQPVDKESTLPSNDLDGQNSAANEGVAASSNDTHAPAEALPVAKRPGFFFFF